MPTGQTVTKLDIVKSVVKHNGLKTMQMWPGLQKQVLPN